MEVLESLKTTAKKLGATEMWFQGRILPILWMAKKSNEPESDTTQSLINRIPNVSCSNTVNGLGIIFFKKRLPLIFPSNSNFYHARLNVTFPITWCMMIYHMNTLPVKKIFEPFGR